jgi:hypothetical protein
VYRLRNAVLLVYKSLATRYRYFVSSVDSVLSIATEILQECFGEGNIKNMLGSCEGKKILERK